MGEAVKHGAPAGAVQTAPLGFFGPTLFARLLAGAPFAAAWMLAVLGPLGRRIETDVPHAMRVGALLLAVVAPVILYLRRHALDASVSWNDQTVTLVRGGRVATSIAWADAIVRVRVALALPTRVRIVQIADRAGRTITLASGTVPGHAGPSGRRRIRPADLDALLARARAHATISAEPPRAEPSGLTHVLGAAVLALGAIALFSGELALPRLAAIAFAGVCLALLVDPARRLRAAALRPSGREALYIDTEERGRLRVRRLDGTRVLLDVGAAAHPDAKLSARRGFVHAVLDVPTEGTGTTYRAAEEPIPATFVETRDDRVLRFEHLRAALVDVIGYGTFFATAVAAVLVA